MNTPLKPHVNPTLMTKCIMILDMTPVKFMLKKWRKKHEKRRHHPHGAGGLGGAAVTTEREQQLLNCINILTENYAKTIWEREALQRKLWSYEKHGVTCQTFGHVVGACAECNTHGEAL